ERLLSKTNIDDPTELKRVSNTIQQRIKNAPISRSLRAEIANAYKNLGDNALVAVRSSATSEDGAEASFAGMFRSHLNLGGIDKVVEGIKDDWASAFGERTLAYSK